MQGTSVTRGTTQVLVLLALFIDNGFHRMITPHHEISFYYYRKVISARLLFLFFTS